MGHALELTSRGTLAILLTALISGCALRPAGERYQRASLDVAGRPWVEGTSLADLPERPTLDDYLLRAFLSNAEIQARYWEWRSAVERIPQESSWPRVAVPLSVMFTRENMRLWDRTTLGIGNDPMSNIPFPTKLATAGRIALEDARAAAARFENAKFLLQYRVRSTYYDLALLAESIRIRNEEIALLEMITRQTAARVASGTATQADLLRAQTNLLSARNEVQDLEARVPGLAAKLNALVGRPSTAPVPLPESLPAPRSLPVDDDKLIAIAAERSNELAALAHEVAGRREALDLARQAYLPDFSLEASIQGSIQSMVGGMIALPTRIEAIRAGIAQARADLAASEAARTQYERDLAASLIVNLYILRNDERQVRLFEDTILPWAQQTIAVAQTAYANDRMSFSDLLEAHRALLEARLFVAELRIEREKALAAIETWSRVDIETMEPGGMAFRAIGEMQGTGRGMRSSGRSPVMQSDMSTETDTIVRVRRQRPGGSGGM